MDKGIRPYIIRRFLELLPTRAGSTDRVTNTNFRKTLIAELMEQFGISLASAATQYNEAFKAARITAQTNEEVAAQLMGLGRPEDKKGGRKRKVVPVEVTSTTDASPAGDETPAAGDETQVVVANQTFRVLRKKDNQEVATGLSKADAEALVERARAAKKGTLIMVEA